VEFSIRSGAPESAQTGCLVLGVYKGPDAMFEMTRATQLADRAAGVLQRVLAQGDLSCRLGSTLLLRAVEGIKADRVLLVGLGEKAKFGEAAFREAVRAATNVLKDIGFGLRLGNSRSALGNVIHIDVAFPLNGDASIHKVQFIVEAKRSF